MPFSQPVYSLLLQTLKALELPEELSARYSAFYEAMLEANRSMNLTRITDADEFCHKHILDTLTLAPWMPASPAQILDLGTGGGVPGVPLWLSYPEHSYTLLDSVAKKLKAVLQICRHCQPTAPEALHRLPETLHMRAEDAGRDKQHREHYDLVVSRAVAALPVLLEYALPLVRRGGRFIAMKGPNYTQETQGLNEIAGILGGRLAEAQEIALANGEQRVLLIFEKRSLTPKTLPRGAGDAKRDPLSNFVN